MRARKRNERGNRLKSHARFLASAQHRARTAPSCGGLRRETRPLARGNGGTIDVNKESEPSALRRGIRQIRTHLTLRTVAVRKNHPYPPGIHQTQTNLSCEPLRFASPQPFPHKNPCNPQRITGVGYWQAAHFRARSPIPPARTLILTNQHGPRIGNGALDAGLTHINRRRRCDVLPRLFLFRVRRRCDGLGGQLRSRTPARALTLTR